MSAWSRTAATSALVTVLGISVTAQVTKREYPGVQNFSRVDATVACGGAITPAAVASLKKDGFVSIVNLRAAGEPGADVEGEGAAAVAAGVKYIHLPFVVATPDPAVVDRFLAAVTDRANQPVFIHCGSANRVAALWLIKRVRVDAWTTERALEEAKAIGLTSEALQKFALSYLAGGK